MAYGNRGTTNNVAECMGLLHDLRYAKTRCLEPLFVVGDSLMIIRQQRHHVSPRQARLAALFRQTRRLADTMRIAGWSHHFRAHNKMADLAANHAMNGGASAQYELPSEGQSAREIHSLLQNDVGQWYEDRQAAECESAL